jgi:hypothetical protein
MYKVHLITYNEHSRARPLQILVFISFTNKELYKLIANSRPTPPESVNIMART